MTTHASCSLWGARDYVGAWLEINNISVKPDGELLDPRRARTRSQLFETLYLDSIEQRRAHNKGLKPTDRCPTLDRTELEAALNEIVDAEKQKHLESIRARLKCDGENLEPLKQHLQCLKGEPPSDLDLAVSAQWHLNVKRKLFGMPTWWEMMVILVGAQGGGKTWITTKYHLKPLRDYTNDGMAVDEAIDSRVLKQLTNHYVMFFDEMSGVQRTDMERLKNLITSSEVAYRPMYSNNIEKLRNNSSFMGASNNPIGLLLTDRTGMRRFYELKCAPKCDISAAETIDYEALWRGIDETKKSYVDDLLPQLRETQAEYKAVDEVALFVEHYGLRPEGDEDTSSIETKVLYGDYKEWSTQHGHPVLQANFFGKKLIANGVLPKNERVKPKGFKYVYVISEAAHQALDSQFRRK